MVVESFIVFSRTLTVIKVVPILSYTVFFTSVIHTITVSVQTLIITTGALLIGLPASSRYVLILLSWCGQSCALPNKIK